MSYRTTKDRITIIALPLLGAGIGYLLLGFPGALQGLGLALGLVLLLLAGRWTSKRDGREDTGSRPETEAGDNSSSSS